jgi:hypothetical protein
VKLDDTFHGFDDEQLIRYQRILIFRMNLTRWDISAEEFKKRQQEYDEFTEWLWNKEKK